MGSEMCIRDRTIRAQCASALGLVVMLSDLSETSNAQRDPGVMLRALLDLPHQAVPSATAPKGLREGLSKVADMAGALLKPETQHTRRKTVRDEPGHA